MPKERINFDQWPTELLAETSVSKHRADDVHEVLDNWRGGYITGELAYKTLALLYWSNNAHDNDATHFYQNDIMRRLAYNADLTDDDTVAIQDEINKLALT